MKGVTFLCERCGCGNVSRDAWADWDIGEQQWVLRAAFDFALCHDCDGETRLVEVELGDRATAKRGSEPA